MLWIFFLSYRFAELKADPSKAKKPHHRPKGAKEFAEKYLEGYYSLVEDEAHIAEAKSHKWDHLYYSITLLCILFL